jgi:hypothetical protein
LEKDRYVVRDAVEQAVEEINNASDEPLLRSSWLGDLGGHVRLAKGGTDIVQFRRNDNLADSGFSGTTDEFAGSVVRPLLLALLSSHA